MVPVHLAVFFLAALLCHSELADDRPAPARLTEFYFWIALGGVLGSLFNTLVAPALFTGVLEYPLMLVVVCLLRRVPDEDSRPRSQAVGYALAVLTAAITLALLRWGAEIHSTRTVFAMLGIPALLCLRTSRLKYPFAVTISLILLTAVVQPDQFGTLLHAERTFFGTYRVRLDPSRRYYSLAHGTTIHGMQSVAPERRSEPLTYYHRSGPFGELFNEMLTASRHPHIAVVGLGVGSLAAYRQPGQAWTFFEIDPAVERIARRQENFTYLSDCGPACQVVLGDARLSIRNAPDHHYGLIVLDAFSSDAIPMHLMTREAAELYLTKLAPDGALAFHISNRHLRLEPVLGRLATDLKLSALATEDLIADSAKGKSGSDWLVMARTPAVLGGLWAKANWSPARMDARVSAWTDDFSNIVSVFGR